MDYIWIFLIVYPIYGLIFYFLHNKAKFFPEFERLNLRIETIEKEILRIDAHIEAQLMSSSASIDGHISIIRKEIVEFRRTITEENDKIRKEYSDIRSVLSLRGIK